MSRAAATVVLAAALCGVAGFVLGRGRCPEESRAPTWLTQVKRQLGLRPDQVARLDHLLAEHDKDLAALVAEHRHQLREPMERRLEQMENDLLTVLDADQRALYQQLEQN